jgi:hypothetical protein
MIIYSFVLINLNYLLLVMEILDFIFNLNFVVKSLCLRKNNKKKFLTQINLNK